MTDLANLLRAMALEEVCPNSLNPVTPYEMQSVKRLEEFAAKVIERMKDGDVSALSKCGATERARLHEIAHLAWHVAESSEEDATTGEFRVNAEDFRALCAALPDEHPPHGFLPKGAKRDK